MRIALLILENMAIHLQFH